MNKKEIVDYIAKEEKIQKNIVARIINTFINKVTTELSKGNNVHINKLGTFNTYIQNERMIKNNNMSEAKIIPQKRVITFKASKLLKEKININE